MKILIVLPEGQLHRLKLGKINMSFREAPLTATTLAALVPDSLKASIQVIDESVSTIPFDKDFDLVAISALTGTSTRAYQIADIFRQKGSTVVLGGVHVTLKPEEALSHADAIVVGFAEKTWPRLLADYSKGKMKSIYHAKDSDVTSLPEPRRDLQKKFGYTMPNVVFATRGCRSKCDFCSVPAAGFGWHKRPVHEVIDSVRKIKSKRFAFNDVHLTDDVEYAKELFTALIPLKKIWGGLAATRVTHDNELLDLLEKSGCRYLLLGFESIVEDSLKSINKGFNRVSLYKDVIDKLHDKNIIVQGCFIFGLDNEDKYIFEQTVNLVNKLKIDIPRYAVYTPYPGTPAFNRLKDEGRLLHEQWEYYNTQHVVFTPKKMTPRELDEGFKWAFRKTFKVKNSFRRTIGSGKNFYISFTGNLAYKIYIRKLYGPEKRFPDSVSKLLDESFDSKMYRSQKNKKIG